MLTTVLWAWPRHVIYTYYVIIYELIIILFMYGSHKGLQLNTPAHGQFLSCTGPCQIIPQVYRVIVSLASLAGKAVRTATRL